MVQSKLRRFIVKYKVSKQCEYCFKSFPEGFEFTQIVTFNEQVLEIFGKRSVAMGSRGSGHDMNVRLCPECFTKLHDLLEETEQQGWVVLDDEFPDDELEGEDGT